MSATPHYRSQDNVTSNEVMFDKPITDYGVGSSYSPPPSVVHPLGSVEKKLLDHGKMAIIGIALGLGLVIVLLLTLGFIWLREKRRRQQYNFGSDSSLETGYLFGNSQQEHSSQWSNSNNRGQHPRPNRQASPGRRGMENVVTHTGMGPPSDILGAPHPLINNGDMSSYYSMSSQPPATPSLSLTPMGTIFTYEELAVATRRFADENIIGHGGFGYVHKGILPCGKEVAVKSLKAESMQGEREFRAEIEIISRVHHRHLVSLFGHCISGKHRMLVYEFVPNNTLDHHLHHRKGVPTLDWPTRRKIALGSAKGLSYLHEYCNPGIIHRDIKASNVLLDDTFEAKVSDFGLAKLSSDSKTHVTTRIMGTFGYMAPEYAKTGKLTMKSDVFSFGVMLLELITGKGPLESTDSDNNLVEWARKLLNRWLQGDGNYEELVDPLLKGNYNRLEMEKMAICAFSCIRHSANKRPKLSEIVRALEGDASLEDLKDGMMRCKRK